jgi:hypothetical protein
LHAGPAELDPLAQLGPLV